MGVSSTLSPRSLRFEIDNSKRSEAFSSLLLRFESRVGLNIHSWVISYLVWCLPLATARGIYPRSRRLPLYVYFDLCYKKKDHSVSRCRIFTSLTGSLDAQSQALEPVSNCHKMAQNVFTCPFLLPSFSFFFVLLPWPCNERQGLLCRSLIRRLK